MLTKGLDEDRAKGFVDWRCGSEAAGGLAAFVKDGIWFDMPVGLDMSIDCRKGFVVCWPGCSPVCMGGDKVPVWKEATEFCGIGARPPGLKLC